MMSQIFALLRTEPFGSWRIILPVDTPAFKQFVDVIVDALPAFGCGRSIAMPRACTCGFSNTSSISLIVPLGTPTSSSLSIHSSRVGLKVTSLFDALPPILPFLLAPLNPQPVGGVANGLCVKWTES